jgi:hypothetical protein
MFLVASGLGRLVEPGLIDDRVDAEGGLARRAVADDQLPLPAAGWDRASLP